jgi:hypothetical protein
MKYVRIGCFSIIIICILLYIMMWVTGGFLKPDPVILANNTKEEIEMMERWAKKGYKFKIRNQIEQDYYFQLYVYYNDKKSKADSKLCDELYYDLKKNINSSYKYKSHSIRFFSEISGEDTYFKIYELNNDNELVTSSSTDIPSP